MGRRGPERAKQEFSRVFIKYGHYFLLKVTYNELPYNSLFYGATPCLDKFLFTFMSYRPKCSHTIKLQDSLINISGSNTFISLIFWLAGVLRRKLTSVTTFVGWVCLDLLRLATSTFGWSKGFARL